jgi:hypothetical protein
MPRRGRSGAAFWLYGLCGKVPSMSKRKNNPVKTAAVQAVPPIQPPQAPQPKPPSGPAFIQDGVPAPFQFIDGEVTIRIGTTHQGRERMAIQTLRCPVGALDLNTFVGIEQSLMTKLHEAAAVFQQNQAQQVPQIAPDPQAPEVNPKVTEVK